MDKRKLKRFCLQRKKEGRKVKFAGYRYYTKDFAREIQGKELTYYGITRKFHWMKIHRIMSTFLSIFIEELLAGRMVRIPRLGTFAFLRTHRSNWYNRVTPVYGKYLSYYNRISPFVYFKPSVKRMEFTNTYFRKVYMIKNPEKLLSENLKYYPQWPERKE